MNNYKHKLIEFYNICYKAYTTNINPTVFLHILVNNIIMLINAKCGVIIRYDNNTQTVNILSHASNINKYNSSNKDIYFSGKMSNNNNWFMFSKFVNEHKMFGSDSLIMKSIIEQKIITSYDCSFETIFGIRYDNYNQSTNEKKGVLIQIPLLLGNITKGIMLIYNDEMYNCKSITDIFKPFDIMMGVLLNNIELYPLHTQNNSIDVLNYNFTFQMILDTLDIINNNIVITDRDMKIIYKNNNGNNIISNISDNTDYLYDIIPQTISLISSTYNNFYKNKHISVELSNTNILDILVNSISTSGDIYYIFDISENIKEIKINSNKKSKNLIAYLSHELRNPIQVISTGVYILSRTIQSIEKNKGNILLNDNTEDDNDKLTDSMLSLNSVDSIDIINIDTDNMETFKSVIKRVDISCKNINIIIDDILDLSKIDSDELIMNIDEHRLLDITNMIYEEYIDDIHKKGLQIKYTTSTGTPEYLYTDDTRVYQILSNLITNAIKYSNTGTIGFNVSYDDNINSIIFTISDQGKGIRKEELNNLFKTYGRTSNSTPDNKSTGLGLCICQKIANLLGGTIDVKSEFNRGSTFIFTHPINLNTSNSKSINNIFNDKNINGNVLIVDDDKNITAMFKLLLKCINYDNGYDIGIDIAHTSDRTLHLTDNKKYNLIFMDIDLDGEDGCVLSDFIHKNSIKNKNSPIVAITANIKAIQGTKDIKFNIFDDILLKPFNSNDISHCIIKYLDT